MPDLKEKNRIILKNSKMHELWDLGAPTILEQALQTIVLQWLVRLVRLQVLLSV